MKTEDEARAAIAAWGENHWRCSGNATPPVVTVETITYCEVEQWWEARLSITGEPGRRHVIFWQEDSPPFRLAVSIREEVMV